MSKKNGNRVSLTLTVGPQGDMRLTGSPGLTPELAIRMLSHARYQIENSEKRSRIVGPQGQPIYSRTEVN